MNSVVESFRDCKFEVSLGNLSEILSLSWVTAARQVYSANKIRGVVLYMLKRIGLRTDPWGRPPVRGNG